jgi:hypothetical protein
MSGGGTGTLGGSGPGGLLPGQQSLVNYLWGEQEVGTANQFSGGMGMSTGATMGSAGDYMQHALTSQELSQADTQAQNAQNAAQKAQTSQGLSNLGSLLGGFGSGFI